MSRKKSQPVSQPKDWRANKLFVGVITAEQLRKMGKAQDRQARIESGIRQTGNGPHGGDKRQINRRARRQWKQGNQSDF